MYDYRIAEAPIVAPEGFELVAEGSDEIPKAGWYMTHAKSWMSLPLDFITTCAENHTRRFARPVVKREPKMPDAPVFWVRYGGDRAVVRFPIFISPDAIMLGHCDGTIVRYTIRDLAYAAYPYEWSADRKTWFDFYGNKV